eukprot:RCo015750
MELQAILDAVPLLPLLEAARMLHGVQFRHPTRGILTFDFKSASTHGENCLQDCLRWAIEKASMDVRAAVSVDCIAAIRSYTGTVMCYVLRHLTTNRAHPRFRDALPFAKLVQKGLRCLPGRFRVSGVKAFRAECGEKESVKGGAPRIFFYSLASFTTNPGVLNNFIALVGPRTLYEVSGLSGYSLHELSCYPDEREVLVEFGTAVDVQYVDRHEAAIGARQVEPGLVTVVGKHNREASITHLHDVQVPPPAVPKLTSPPPTSPLGSPSEESIKLKLKSGARACILMVPTSTTFEQLLVVIRAAGYGAFAELTFEDQDGDEVMVWSTTQLEVAFAYYHSHLAKEGRALRLSLQGESAQPEVSFPRDFTPQGLLREALAGNAPAQVTVAVLRRMGELSGEGTQPDLPRALATLSPFVMVGYPVASALGELWRGTSADPKPCLARLRVCAAGGDPTAEWVMGYCLEFGPQFATGISESIEEATEWYAKAAKKGHPGSQFSLGLCYATGAGIAKDLAKAKELYQQSAQNGNASAQFSLGECYFHGRGVAKDLAKAAEMFQKAAEQGNASAQFSLGQCYEWGQGVAKDLSKAIELYQKSAEQGNGTAQYCLGWFYFAGKWVDEDVSMAVELFQKAAEQGNAQAQNHLGFCYEHGEGVAEDLSKAVELFQKAAQQGYSMAQFNLGTCFEHGIGIGSNLLKAAEQYRKAAEQGNTKALSHLGSCYEHGKGVGKDLSKAIELYQEAAEQGDASGQNNLGLCFEQGKGVDEDLSMAAELYRRAAEQGFADGQDNLDRLM